MNVLDKHLPQSPPITLRQLSCDHITIVTACIGYQAVTMVTQTQVHCNSYHDNRSIRKPGVDGSGRRGGPITWPNNHGNR